MWLGAMRPLHPCCLGKVAVAYHARVYFPSDGGSPFEWLCQAACEDGCVRLFSISAGQLAYERSFDKQDTRILSLGWHPSEPLLVSGDAAGTIRVWDTVTGRVKRRICVAGESCCRVGERQ